MRSIGWLKFRYIRKHRLLCITHKDIHRIFHEYLAKYISIHSYNRYSRKCDIMKCMQRSTSLAYSKSAWLLLRKARIRCHMIFAVVLHSFHWLNVNYI